MDSKKPVIELTQAQSDELFKRLWNAVRVKTARVRLAFEFVRDELNTMVVKEKVEEPEQKTKQADKGASNAKGQV